MDMKKYGIHGVRNPFVSRIFQKKFSKPPKIFQFGDINFHFFVFYCPPLQPTGAERRKKLLFLFNSTDEFEW
jgi:hypothetical protein